ncbi:MAG: hypothetical protein H7222_06900 [Methylotenera sp.]|nr:hypothetical protein [Oligoflexia bacterium]
MSQLDYGIIGNCQVSALIDKKGALVWMADELWGNFPQTCSHVGLINTAMRISQAWEDAF